MFTNKQTFGLTALAVALTGASGAALAQDETVTQLTKPNSWFSLGAGWWSDNRPQEGQYDGMNQKGWYGLFDAFINKRDDATGTWYSLDARNLGLDTREIRADWLRQGNIGAFIEFSQTPRESPYTFNTGLRGIGTTNQVVSGAGANALPFAEYQLGTRRDLWNIGGYKNLIPGLDVKVNYKHEEKTGNRQWGRGSAPEFAVEPIDSTTQQAEVVLNYMRDKLQLQGGWYGSWWTQNTSGLVDIITNGLPTAPIANHTYLTLPLDNQAQQFFLNGGYNFTPATRGTFKLSYTHATQNESLPTQSIPGLSLAGTPQSLDGELNTTLAQLGVTSRTTANFSWLANLRYYNAEEKTPQTRWVQTGALPCGTGSTIIPPGTAGATCVDNTPLGFETWSGKVEGTYRLPQGFSLIGGIDYADQDRVVPVGIGTVGAGGVDRQRYVPFKSNLEETTYRVQVRRGLSETINGSLGYLYSRRSGSGYTLTNEPESDEINPIHIAKRDRNRWRLMLDWTPLEALSFTFNYENARDDYDTSPDRPYALTKGTGQIFSIDASYAISDLWRVNAWYSWDQQTAEQYAQRAANSGAGAAEKLADLEDTGNTFGVGLRGVLMPKLRVGADLLYANQDSKYPETITLTGPGAVFPTAAGVTVAPLQDINNRLTRFKLFAGYAVHKNGEVFVDYIWEQWKSDDWSWTFANGTTFTYGTTTDGTQVLQAPKQTSNFIGVRYIYKFQ